MAEVQAHRLVTWRRWWIAAGICAALAGGAVGGVWLDRSDLVGTSIRRVQAWARIDNQHVQSRELSSHFQQLRVAEIHVTHTMIDGGSVVAVGEHLLISSPHGQLTYLDPDDRLHALAIAAPLNIEELRGHRYYNEPTFVVRALRALDMLVMPAGDHEYDLFVTHDRFSSECVDFVVSSIRLHASPAGLRPRGQWREVWRAGPCLRFADVGEMVGMPPQTGGRMVQLNDREIAVSVGDYGHVGVTDRSSVAMDPAYDYGKIVALDVTTGQARRIAAGFRNPQGLTRDRRGRLWATDHGPQGGDEINLVVEGENYGWPVATYGMDYTSPPERWPRSPRVSTHAGYARPRHAFVPSIGISAIAAADPREFPNWADSLLVASMRAQTLFVARMEGEDIVFAEPIPLGRRLRDIETLPDGRLAILADGGTLLLISNAEHDQEGGALNVVGFNALPAAGAEETPRAEGTRIDWGRAAFEASCATCHSVNGRNGAGPPLNGVIGRDVASIDSFPYSDALRELDGAWTEESLVRFILDPQAAAPGSAMQATPLSPHAAHRIAAYLQAAPAEEALDDCGNGCAEEMRQAIR